LHIVAITAEQQQHNETRPKKYAGDLKK